MGNNNLKNDENIFVKVDQNNLIYIDPNSVIVDNKVEPRGVKQENLIMYVNLEADLVPRTTLIKNSNDANNIVNVASGTLNFLKNSKNGDFDTTWTDVFNSNSNVDSTAQSFGIESININIKSGFNNVPTININFTDVRGKTLFESPQNSPYKAFFHLPWPIYYLTVKGYYGKAIRYRLHMVKFTSKFNESNGNFDITTTFVGSTYAYLNDIPLQGILNAPYMYLNDSLKEKEFNQKTLRYRKYVSKSSKGYSLLKSVYSDYVNKGYLPKEFKENPRTLREIITIAKTLDATLEREILDQTVDMKIFSGIKEFEIKMKELTDKIIGWGSVNLSNVVFTEGNIDYFYQTGKDKGTTKNIIGINSINTLEYILNNGINNLKKSKILTEDIKNRTDASFKKVQFSFPNTLSNIQTYVKSKDSNFAVALQKILDDVLIINKSFNEQKLLLQKKVEEKINEIVKNKEKGIGFEPSIRNIFGVIMAHADVYIKLLKEVHTNAFNASNTRFEALKGFSNESVGNAIYPWPEIIKQTASKQNVITYPGDNEIKDKLDSSNPIKWPEIEFLENYHKVATKKLDPLTENESGLDNVDLIFDDNFDLSKIKNISTLMSLNITSPYIEKDITSIIYEIYERAKISTLLDEFNNKSIIELANNEFKNIQELLKDDGDINEYLKNVNNTEKLIGSLYTFSPNVKYPYYEDSMPTTNYISDALNKPYKIEESIIINDINTLNNDFSGTTSNLLKYNIEDYRKIVFPFSSNLYKTYTNGKVDDNINNLLTINNDNGFVVSKTSDIKLWIKNNYIDNIFSQKLTISNSSKGDYILNTPLFHKQLKSDFEKIETFGKYAGSAYLLLNTLPFNDLQDKCLNDVRFSTLFTEVSATHYIPYLLILKWGSLYHRYKKILLENEDIIYDDINVQLSGGTFYDYDNRVNHVYTPYNLKTVIYADNNDIGFHPFYESLFNQIVNGYSTFDVILGNNSYSGKTLNKSIIVNQSNKLNDKTYWTSIVNNSVYNADDKFYTLLPTFGVNNQYNKSELTNYNDIEASNLRTIWEDNVTDNIYDGFTFPNYDDYCLNNQNLLKFDDNYKKIFDLISTFNPQILDEFERIFLLFSTEKTNTQSNSKLFKSLSIDNFQTLLKEMVTVEVNSSDNITIVDDFINKLKVRQSVKIKKLSSELLSNNNFIKVTIGNSKDIDPHVWGGFIGVDKFSTLKFNAYNETIFNNNENLMNLYLGTEPEVDSYKNFFKNFNIEPNEENIIRCRSLVYHYSGFINSGGLHGNFKNHINTKFFEKANARFNLFTDTLTPLFNGLKNDSKNEKMIMSNGFNDLPLKTELYNYFKSFNDKWIAGNSIGQKLLIEEFLFLDGANKDIGDVYFLTMDKLVNLENNENINLNLYSMISLLINNSNIDMRALPAYLNFYEKDKRKKILSSKKVASNLFGTFLEVDYENATPKIILQYVGPTSKYYDDENGEQSQFRYKNDTFYIGSQHNNPLIYTIPDFFNENNLLKSNKVVGFEVNVGDENQGIFKGIGLDQTSIRNTTESFIIQENLGRSATGAAAHQVDIGLFDIYRQASYSCDVSCMGNVMIQPTMYFYLNNVPLFKGTYLITDVSHKITNNTIGTTFKGIRIPKSSLPDPKESYMASYRVLFDKITNNAIIKQKEDLERNVGIPSNETTLLNYTIDKGLIEIKGETDVNNSGMNKYGVRYNGFNGEKYIQLVNNLNFKNDKDNISKNYFRAVVAVLGSTKSKYKLDDNNVMDVYNYIKTVNVVSNNTKDPNHITWGQIKTSKNNFYGINFDIINLKELNDIIKSKIIFTNPNNKKTLSIEPITETTITPQNIHGPAFIGPNVNGYGIAISSNIAKKLDIKDGQVIYFEMI